MLLRNTESNVRPSAVLLDEREDGKRVRLADSVREEERDGETVFVYDEVVFTLEPDREETAEDIAADFEGWWEYGSQDEEPLPTIEERVSLIEEMLLGGM